MLKGNRLTMDNNDEQDDCTFKIVLMVNESETLQIVSWVDCRYCIGFRAPNAHHQFRSLQIQFWWLSVAVADLSTLIINVAFCEWAYLMYHLHKNWLYIRVGSQE
jgi:hypothetical protein